MKIGPYTTSGTLEQILTRFGMLLPENFIDEFLDKEVFFKHEIYEDDCYASITFSTKQYPSFCWVTIMPKGDVCIVTVKGTLTQDIHSLENRVMSTIRKEAKLHNQNVEVEGDIEPLGILEPGNNDLSDTHRGKVALTKESLTLVDKDSTGPLNRGGRSPIKDEEIELYKKAKKLVETRPGLTLKNAWDEIRFSGKIEDFNYDPEWFQIRLQAIRNRLRNDDKKLNK